MNAAPPDPELVALAVSGAREPSWLLVHPVEDGPTITFLVVGTLDEVTAPALVRQVRGGIRAGVHACAVLDVVGLDACTPAGLAALHDAMVVLAALDIGTTLVGCDQLVGDVPGRLLERRPE